MERPTPLSAVAISFLQKAGAFFSAEGYYVGDDVSDLMTERQQTVADFALEGVGKILELLHIQNGPTGTKQIVQEKATAALAPFREITDLLAWRASEIVPVLFADEISEADLQLLLDAYFTLAQKAANAISETKYGGFVRIFPLLLFSGKITDLNSIRDVRIGRKFKSFWLNVQLSAAILTLGDRTLRWAPGAKPSKPLTKINSLLLASV